MRDLINSMFARKSTRNSRRGSVRRAVSRFFEGLEERRMLSVAPTSNPGGPYVLNEGSSITITGSGEDSDGTVASYQWDLDYDGSFNGSVNQQSFLLVASDDAPQKTIALKVTDNDGDFTIATTTLTVNNVAPTINTSGANSINEGSSYALNFSATNEPGTDALTGWSVDWGDGTVTNHAANASSATHTFADGDDSYTITVTATDEDGSYNANRTVNVLNVAPTTTLGGNAAVNEGASYSLTLGAITDPGADTVSSWVVNWGDGSTDTFNAAGVQTHTYTDGAAAGTARTIVVDLVDEDGTYSSVITKNVTVNNVTPTIALTGNNSVNEGATFTLNLGAVTEPGGDTITSYLVNWGDGTTDTFATTGDKTHAYLNGGNGGTNRDVTVSIVDEDGTHVAGTHSVTVNNVAPAATINGAPANSAEGTAIVLTSSVVDPATGETRTYAWSVTKNGGNFGSGTASTFSFTPDDDGAYVVTLTVNDGDGGTDTETANITVTNVDPTATATGADTASEGTVYSLTLGTATDPGADAVTQYIVNWGDGNSDTYGAGGVKTHTYGDAPAAGTARTITVDLVDEEGTYTTVASKGITVSNTAPTIATSGNNTVYEGGTYTLTLGAVTDPGSDTITSYIVDWGDGTNDTYGAAGNKTHIYSDGDADPGTTRNISVTLVDEDGSHAAAGSKTISVLDANPVVDVSGGAAILEGATYSLTLGAVSDPGPDTVTQYIVDWADGTIDTYGTNGVKTHLYSDDGWFNIRISLVDEDGLHQYIGNGAVTVMDVAPTIAVSGNAAADEGATFSLTLGAITEPGADTVTEWIVDWNDGTTDTYTSGGVKTHVFVDGASFGNNRNITVTLVDEEGIHPGTGTHTVTINNVAPTIALSGSATAQEGTTYSLTLGSITDPGADTVTDWVVDWGDGTSDTFNSAGVKTHTYGDAPAAGTARTISVDLVDEDGTHSAAGTKNITVQNVAPTIALTGNANVNEATQYTLNLGAVTDPGSETITDYIVHWGDGTSDTYNTAGAKTHTYSDGALAASIVVDLIDEDGPYTSAGTFNVSVDNVAPTIALAGNNTVNEGASYTLTLGAITDPGADTVTSWIVNWGDGNVDTFGSGGDKTHTFADGSAAGTAYNISVSLVDEDGTHATAGTKSVTVNNVAPTINISGDANVNEGASYTLVLGAITDAGNDAVTSWIVDWGDGTTDTYTSTGNKTHVYADGSAAGTARSIIVDLVDDDGTHTAAGTTNVTVDNVAPAITLGGSATAQEGVSYTLTLGALTEPGTDTVSQWIVDWGDGTTDTFNDAGAKTHTYVDGSAAGTARTISVDLVDEDGTFSAAGTKAITVQNVAPTIALTGNSTVNEGTSFSLNLGAITDSGSDTASQWIVNWGDGSSNTYGSAGAKTHTYADGSLAANITVDVVDEDGTHTAAGTFALTVNDVAPTIAVSGNAAVNEGASFTLTLGAVTEPGLDTITFFVVDWGDGNIENFNNAGAKTHVYADGAAAGSTMNIAVALVDEDGLHTGAGAHSVTVNDVSPTIAVTNAGSIGEGATFTLTLGAITDAGADTATSWNVDWGDGSSETFASGGDKTHTYADGSAAGTARNIIVDIVDEDGTHSAAGTSTVTVTNVAPTISLGGAGTALEGSVYSLTLGSITEPGTDTVSQWIVDWGDGTTDTFNDAGVKTHTYGDAPGAGTNRTISVDLVDEDGTHTAAGTQNLTVSNVAPTIALAGSSSVNEGATYTLGLGAVTDPGTDTVSSFVINWGDGQTSTVNSIGDVTHAYADGSAAGTTRTITVDLVDEDGTFTSAATKTITVLDVSPTVTVTGNESVSEGSVYTVGFSTAGDPGTDTVTGFTINWGDGTTDVIGGLPTSANHTYANNGSFTITVSAVDEDGSHPGTKAITVNNVAPTATVTGSGSANEGSAYTLNLSATDPGTADAIAWTINWGDGQTSNASGLSTTASHSYADNGSYNISVVANDGVDTDTETANVSVANVAPSAAAVGSASANEGAVYTLNLNATDPGSADTFTWVIDWGDGQTSNFTGATGSVTHTFADDGYYQVTATVEDDDSDSDSGTGGVTVADVAPTITITGSSSVEEGSLYTLGFSATDPGDDTITQWIVDWGDGTVQTYAADASSATHTFADGLDNISIEVALTNEDDTFGANKAVAVSNVDPEITLTGTGSAVEGATYSLGFGATDVGDDTISQWLIDWGDGNTETVAGNLTSATHAYADNGSYSIEVTATDDDGTTSATQSVTVTNAAPQGTLAGPTKGVRGQARRFNATATDAGTEDTLEIAWDFGDGTSLPYAAAGPSSLSVSKNYVTTGTYTVTLSIRDKDGQVVTQTRNITVAAANLQTDPTDNTKQALFVGATNGNDIVRIIKSGSNLQVRINGILAGSFAPTGRVFAYGLNGNDTISLGDTVTKAAFIYGGNGNDSIVGTAANDVILGGAGRDTIYGMSGRDVMIGGAGNDRLDGGGEADILIAASAAAEGSVEDLAAIMTAWARTDQTTSQRVSALRADLLADDTLTDDGFADVLTGVAGRNWLVFNSTQDVRNGVLSSDVSTDIA